jgi:hypothetical protein
LSEHNAALSEALETWVNSLPAEVIGEDIGMLGEWIAVVSMVSVDSEGDPRTEYYLAMRNGTMLPHVAIGLLYQGLEEVRGSRKEAD